MKPRILLLTLLFLGSVCSYEMTGGVVLSQATALEEGWRTELENLCNRTNEAATFSRAHLQELVTRCDKLKPVIEALDGSSRKVYGKRLQLCREFYAFMLQSKEAGEGSKEGKADASGK